MENKKEKLIKISKAEYKEFKTSVEKWMKIFGLVGWKIWYDIQPIKDAYAQIDYDVFGRTAVFTLQNQIDQISYEEFYPDLHAFHEVCHVLLAKLIFLAQSRYITPDEIEEEVHNLIRIFENVLYKEFKRKGKNGKRK